MRLRHTLLTYVLLQARLITLRRQITQKIRYKFLQTMSNRNIFTILLTIAGVAVLLFIYFVLIERVILPKLSQDLLDQTTSYK